MAFIMNLVPSKAPRRSAILFLVLLLAMASPVAVLADITSNGYTYSDMVWSADGFLTFDLTNSTNGTRSAVMVTCGFLDAEGNSLLETTLPVGTLAIDETFQVHAFIGPREEAASQFTILVRDDRSPNVQDSGEDAASNEPQTDIPAADIPIDRTFTGSDEELTDTFQLGRGTYYFYIEYEDGRDYVFTLTDKGGAAFTTILKGTAVAKQLVELEVKMALDYRIRVTTLGRWSIRVFDADALERLRKEQERNRFDMETTDDGTLIITN